ncbi:MAG TPA: redoxin domain-containing protein, partial [Gaiellaceae bacterium]|nr:redoxin domain-containing protein [Gaiellaceae bacterium]
SRKGGAVGLAVAAIISLSFVLPDMLGSKSTSEAAHAKAMGVAVGAGVAAGSAVPSFSGTDLLSGQTISNRSVYNQKTLLFFSEGVMCQACFQQIQGLQQVGNKLATRGIQLVSITPDSTGELQQAAQQYGITTPLISDSSRGVSEAFNTLGQGMHSNTPGHAFALIYHGKVLWYRDYYQPPYRTMYVPPKKLLADIPRA